jgi:hypothetical protein
MPALQQQSRRPWRKRPFVEVLEDRYLLSAYIVNSAGDDGDIGELRDAINQANATGSTITEIDFHIGTVGSQQTISLTSALPALTASNVNINGLSQGGAGNTTPLIQLDGGGIVGTTGINGLVISGSSCTVSGLVISHFFDDGLVVGGSNNLITDNYLGTDLSGTKAVGNSVGALIEGSGITIGGTAKAAGNLISGNVSQGLYLSAVGPNLVEGNFIGTDKTGTKAVANGHEGVVINENGDTLGGTTAGARNLISGNTLDGVYLLGGQDVVEGNYIGTDITGTKIVSNGGNGVTLLGAFNTVGGTVKAAGNVISGNNNDGVMMGNAGAHIYALIEGNYIGTDAAGANPLPNGKNGVENSSDDVTIGGTTTGARNVISGNSNAGILIDFIVSSVTVQGNFLGTNAAGTSAVGNSVGLEIAAPNLTLGGTTAAARNVISGNTKAGVLIDGSASGGSVEGNYIGTDKNGLSAVANGIGIDDQASSNIIGGLTAAARNVISGNTLDGVLLDNFTSGIQVQGNYVGTDKTGGTALANGTGVEVDSISASGNVVGGSVSGARNVISGNTNDGVKIDSNVSGVTVAGNFIGLNTSGGGALSNSIGVEDASGLGSNTIGGTSYYARNIISGNSADGVLLDSGSNADLILNNFIGTTFSGTGIVGNSSNGIEVASTGNTIGGTATGTRNVISGNSNDGVLFDSGASGNQVLGNYVGPDLTASFIVGNFNHGIETLASNNTIGGATTAARNVISGNANDGILIDSGVTGTQVQGNYIGTDKGGTFSIQNFNGIEVANSNNTIGGTTAGARNLISGNNRDGIKIDSGVSGVLVVGNYIGVDYTGNNGLGNANGVEIAGINNTIGGTAPGTRNVISNNQIMSPPALSIHPHHKIVPFIMLLISGDGVLIDGSGTGNLVQGNYIGTNAGGTGPLPNSNAGVDLYGNTNTIGGTVAGARNIISGNGNFGVELESGVSGNLVQGNYIGTDYTGNSALANQGYGIYDDATGNTLGGTVAGARNVIAANASNGVFFDSGASGELLAGNYIGLGAAGAALGNSANGVEILGNNITVGGLLAGARNVISGNSGDGVSIAFGASGDVVLGNYIGTNTSGSASIANTNNGVENDGNNNTIGGSVAGARNVIDGNNADGVLLDSDGAGNVVQGNFIGLNANGNAALGNSTNGVEVQGSNNAVGGTTYYARNYIAGNGNDGVQIDGNASGVAVQGNWIGLDFTGKVAVGNSSYGVAIAGSNNTIGGTATGASNSIANNAAGGVLVQSGSGNTIRHNSIFANGPSNTGPGITLNGSANNSITAPTLSTATLIGGTLTVTGTFTAPTANVTYVLEFFANPTGDPEGKIYLGARLVKPTTTGTTAFTFTTTTTVTGSNPVITATLTDASGDTSAFSGGVTVS